MPFQLSPVETLKSSRNAIPKFLNVAYRPRPSHGWSSSQTGGEDEEEENSAKEKMERLSWVFRCQWNDYKSNTVSLLWEKQLLWSICYFNKGFYKAINTRLMKPTEVWACTVHVSLLKSPNSSTPRAAKIKKRSMKRRPRFPTCRETTGRGREGSVGAK